MSGASNPILPPVEIDTRLDEFMRQSVKTLVDHEMSILTHHEVWTLERELFYWVESPIERYMLVALRYGSVEYVGDTAGVAHPDVFQGFSKSGWKNHDASKYWIYPQAVIGKYRVDFVVAYTPDEKWPVTLIVVECDGHEFHEKTKEQAARDKARDRYLTTNGYKVLRFTGSEIYHDAKKCAIEVFEAFGQSTDAYMQDIFDKAAMVPA